MLKVPLMQQLVVFSSGFVVLSKDEVPANGVDSLSNGNIIGWDQFVKKMGLIPNNTSIGFIHQCDCEA